MSIHPATVAPHASRGANAAPLALDVVRIREDFPILRREVHGQSLVYFDNAATTQKPQAVLDALQHYYTHDNANIHRAVHLLSERATRAYEEARHKVCRFLGASEPREIIFTRGTTESINLVAQSWGRTNLRAGDEIILSAMEHHSNIVPWQMVCEQTGAVLRVAPIGDNGEFLLDEYEKLLSDRTRLVAIVHVSNSLGTIVPVRRVIELAHARSAIVLIDGAQSVSHLPVNVRELDCDFFVLSGHKVYGPTGIGALYGKAHLLERMPPYQGGGDMIKSVTFAKTTFAELPNKFEAGTPHIAGTIGLGAALDYVRAVGPERIAAHEDKLLRYATEKMRQISGVRLIGDAPHKAAVISFVIDEPPIASLDIGTKLDLEGIAVRTGHHCCQPVMDRFEIPGTTRVSFAMYNTTAEVDLLVDALRGIIADAPRTGNQVRVSADRAPMYPSACAATPQLASSELIEAFDELEDFPEERQNYLEKDLSRKIPVMPASYKTEANRVQGCMSLVHLHARLRPGTDDVVEFVADSDSDTVKGLIYILQQIFSGQKARSILAFDVDAFFIRLRLEKFISTRRRNGLDAMVQRIRQFAATLADRPQ